NTDVGGIQLENRDAVAVLKIALNDRPDRIGVGTAFHGHDRDGWSVVRVVRQSRSKGDTLGADARCAGEDHNDRCNAAKTLHYGLISEGSNLKITVSASSRKPAGSGPNNFLLAAASMAAIAALSNT